MNLVQHEARKNGAGCLCRKRAKLWNRANVRNVLSQGYVRRGCLFFIVHIMFPSVPEVKSVKFLEARNYLRCF